jgi:tetratricopeptide (TPR) repeat protein
MRPNTALLILFLLVLNPSGSWAQNATIDALLKELETAPKDTHRVNVLKDLSWQLIIMSNYEQALTYATEAETLARALSYRKGEADALHMAGLAYFKKSAFEKALDLSSRSLKVKESIGDRKGMAASYNSIGAIHTDQGNYPEAIKNHLASLKIKEEIGNRSGMASSYANIGIVHQYQGNYPEAMKNHLAALKIEEEIDDRNGMAGAYNDIGNIHFYQGNYPEAMKNHLAALKIREEIGDRRGMAFSYSNIGNIHISQGNYSEAMKNHLAGLIIREEVGHRSGMASSYENIGGIHFYQGNYPEAMKNYLAALKIREEIGDRRGMSFSYLNIGIQNNKLGNHGDARKWLNKGLLLAAETGEKDNIKDLYIALTRLDSTTGNWRGAYFNHLQYILYRDSLFNEENTKQLTRLEMQYEFDKKEAITKAEQEKKDAIATEQLRRKNQQRNAFIGGFALMLWLAGVSYRSYRVKKYDNTIITAQKEKVEKQNEAILASLEYAKKLQQAVLPPDKVVKEFFADSFLLYLPRDIVSGDFYWMESRNSISYFAVGDCTGHGVPGAMLSVMGLNGLNRALNELHITQPADLLTQLTKDLHDAFERSEATVRDGMDMSICALDTANRKLTYAGANNPLWIARNGEIIVHRPNKRPVGFHDMQGEGFSQEEIELKKGDIIYLFSDGYADQLGGPKGMKMMTKMFRSRLAEISRLPMAEQREQLFADLDAWRGAVHHTDDVCVMGVRV